MQKRNEIGSWSVTGIVEALVVDDNAAALSLMMTFRMAFRYNRFYAAANGMLKAAKEIVNGFFNDNQVK